MDDVKQDYREAMDKILALDETKRKLFALLVVSLAKCYTNPEYKAVVLVRNDEALLTFSAGANGMEAVEMVMTAHEVFKDMVMEDTPPKEMFN